MQGKLLAVYSPIVHNEGNNVDMWTIQMLSCSNGYCRSASGKGTVKHFTRKPRPTQHVHVWTEQLMTMPCRAVSRSTTACELSIYVQTSSYVE